MRRKARLIHPDPAFRYAPAGLALPKVGILQCGLLESLPSIFVGFRIVYRFLDLTQLCIALAYSFSGYVSSRFVLLWILKVSYPLKNQVHSSCTGSHQHLTPEILRVVLVTFHQSFSYAYNRCFNRFIRLSPMVSGHL